MPSLSGTPSFEDITATAAKEKSGKTDDDAATLSDIDKFLFENFHSVRFFISSGLSARFVVDEASTSSPSTSNDSSAASEESSANDSSVPEDFIAMLTYSPSPYEDFQRSMQEMVEARMERNGKVD